MDNVTNWRKASYSSTNGGNCVETGGNGYLVAVRDSQNPEGGRMTMPTEIWRAFISRLQHNQ